jgi:hypothetical protein
MDINETDIINEPIFPILKVGHTIIWDFTELDRDDLDDLLTNNNILQPKKNENYYFCL